MKAVLIQFFRLIFILFLTYLVGWIISEFLTVDATNWLNSLNLPPLLISPYLFILIWMALYSLGAIAAFTVWDDSSPRWFCLQLITVAAGAMALLYFRSLSVSAVISLLTICCSLLAMRDFAKSSLYAAILLFPTFIWGLYTFYLNGYLFLFNK